MQQGNETRAAEQDRQLGEIVSMIRAMPKAHRNFDTVMRAWTRAGLMPADDAGDAKLLAAWESWKATVSHIEDLGSADSAYEYYVRARDDADDVLLDAIATTPAGAAAKLRFALHMGGPARWISDAIMAGDDLTLFARADQISSERRGVVDTLALLVRPADTTVRDAFEAWAAAWVAWNEHLRDHDDTDANNQALQREAIRLETALAVTPPRSADDMLFKLLPLAMGYISASGGPFAIHLDARDPDDDTLDGKAMHGLARGMLALSPRIAELVAMRWPRREPIGAAEAFDRLAGEYAASRDAVNSGAEPDGGPIGDAYSAAADAMDQAVPTSFEQFARKFVCVHEDGRPSPEIEQEMMAQARRLLSTSEAGRA